MERKNKTSEITMILLAAGNSRRFGSNKLLVEYKGKPLYQHTVEVAVEAQAELKKQEVYANIIMVSQYEEILTYGLKLGLEVVENTEPERGISYSIKLGLAAAQTGGQYLFFVCDQPLLTCESVLQLVKAYFKCEKSLGSLACNHHLGNPCIFHESWAEKLKTLQGDEGGKKIIKEHIEDTLAVEIIQAKELWDMDTMSDFLQLKNDSL